MATSSCSQSEDQFLCSICLDVFTKPVTTPCGHNFCMACVSGYWDTTDHCLCPLCKRRFYRRPELFVNTFIADMADQFMHAVQEKSPVSQTQTQQRPTKPGETACDVCTGTKLKACKSCLVCLTSFCETHLQPHQIAPALKRHTLIDPVDNLEEDRTCKKHNKFLELFCRTDQMCVCQFCTETDHKDHHTVPIEEECEERKAQLGKTEAQVQHLIQERLQKIQEMKHSVDLRNKYTQREKAKTIQLFTDLVQSFQKSQTDYVEVVEEEKKAEERWAERLIWGLEQEMAGLQRRRTELEKLSNTEDHLHLLQSSASLCSFPPTMDLSQISIHTKLCVGNLRRALCQLAETLRIMPQLLDTVKTLHKSLCDSEHQRMQQYAVDVTLDPDTANCKLVLSEDGKQVRLGDIKQHLPDKLARFDTTLCVLGKEGFSSGRFYYELEVKGKTDWSIGVARESINRKGRITLSPKNGYWILSLRNGDEYTAGASPFCSLSLREKPQKVGVFVDYEEGQVSFYDVEAKSPIHSFIDYTFTEKLYPYICPGKRSGNSAPLIISTIDEIELFQVS
ncbi:E3 ubiquitin-protein ligase TRIM39-like [Salvelinus alpinus]|uniref:E3 ubiquitin-protein ligase TRIM39-like n=1 Tax=Salvelinus alpinus TaxID=8036 RepID=UPI0039FC18E5